MVFSNRIELRRRASGAQRGGTGDVAVERVADDLSAMITVPPRADGVVVAVPDRTAIGGCPVRVEVLKRRLNRAGLAVVRVDLLSPADGANGERLDVPYLAVRLVQAVRLIVSGSPVDHLPIGLLGAGCTGAVALWAAAHLGPEASSVVCWSGRPDLARRRLADVTAATLLVVGDRDDDGFERNLEAQGALRCRTHLRVIPGATESLTEPAALLDVDTTTVDWFARHLAGQVATWPPGELTCA